LLGTISRILRIVVGLCRALPLAQLAQFAPGSTNFVTRDLSQIKPLGAANGEFWRVVTTLGIFFVALS
jgi:hypothetical protein